MTRKDFQLLAKALREAPIDNLSRRIIANTLSEALQQTNPLFSAEKFRKAIFQKDLPEIIRGRMVILEGEGCKDEWCGDFRFSIGIITQEGKKLLCENLSHWEYEVILQPIEEFRKGRPYRDYPPSPWWKTSEEGK